MAKGRGRLTGIDLLPEPCAPVVAWAAEELQKRERTQTEIYEEFVVKLEALDREYRGELEFTIPSFSAFNRYSIRLATLTQRLHQTREIAAGLAEKFDVGTSDDMTIIAAELLKVAVFELTSNAGEAGLDAKSIKDLGAGLRAAIQAQGMSTTRRQKVERELTDKVGQAVDAVEKAGKTMDKAAVLQIIRDAYAGGA
ncbi:phage protein Gp27 family protein [Neorhizobium petrolearium]|uniref:phage protein Gp27 family protein n=1 Tax=Neorhizobium petrolearium TaxID=515361 RepID=UPI003F80E068